MNALNQFLNNYKESNINYYMEQADKFNEERSSGVDYKLLLNTYDKEIVEFARVLKEYNNTQFENRLQKITKFVEKDVESKRNTLIKKVEKIVGQIEDASKLQINHQGELDGIIKGNKGIAKIETISAGGYNIQRRHYRVLVKQV
jgi:hypothetical protein